MITTEQFFEAFDAAGFLKPATWTPSAGLPGAGIEQSPSVRFKAPQRDALGGEFSATDYSIRYPATVLLGLRRGELLEIDGVTYRVRTDPHTELDGSVMQANLARVA